MRIVTNYLLHFSILILRLEIHFAMINNKNKLLMTSIIAMTFLIGFTANEAYAGVVVPCEDGCLPCEDDCRITLLVDIDVKPGSDPNSVNVNTKGVLPVAIIGSDDFDATQIDPSSIIGVTTSVDAFVDAFDDEWFATPLRCSIDDVNDDGILDVNCKFSKEGLMLDCWTNGIIISGNLFDGTPFTGSDTIRPVPCAEDF